MRRSKWLVFGAILLLPFGNLDLKAQFLVHDPVAVTQAVANSTREIVYTSQTAETMLENFKETVRIYNQGKEYFDALRKVNDLVRSSWKVQRTVLMVEEVSKSYVEGFQWLLDENQMSASELSAIAFGYARLMEESAGALEQLRQVVSLTTLMMNDKERLDVVDDCYDRLLELRGLCAYYTRKMRCVSVLRARSAAPKRIDLLKPLEQGLR